MSDLVSRAQSARSARAPMRALERKRTPEAELRFSLVRCGERAEELRDLRRAAYGCAGKSGPERPDSDQSDPRDDRAMMILAEVGGRLVGSLRVIPPGPGPILHPQCRLEGDLGTLPPFSEIAEGGWGCVHPDFGGRGLFWQLSARMFTVAHEFGANWLIAGSDAQLWQFWQRCGFRKTGITYRGVYSKAPYSMMIANIADVLRARDVDPELAKALKPLVADLDLG